MMESNSVHGPLHRRTQMLNTGDSSALDDAMAAAPARGELSLALQPIVDLATGETQAAEALLRWTHPLRGLLLPSAFISRAERSGAIGQLGEWVVNAACRQLAAWRAEGVSVQQLAVNVSPVELLHPGFAAGVLCTLARYDLEPSTLTVELTETSALDNQGAGVRQLRLLRTQGVEVAIDDFGAGFASLMRLEKVPATRLKLDHSLVRDLGVSDTSETLVRTAINLGHELGMQVTAEGVEQPAQAMRLRELHCDAGQGQLFGMPETTLPRVQPRGSRHAERTAG